MVRHAVAAQLANTSHTTQDASFNWNPKLLGLAAGTFLAGLFVAPDAAERRRRRKEEARRARRLMFDQTAAADPWQDDWDDVVEDTATSNTSPPDRWESEIDSLCDALFNGPVDEPVGDAEFESTFEDGFESAFEPAFEDSFEAGSEPDSEPAAGSFSPVATHLEPEQAVALEAPPPRLEPKRSVATCPSRDPVRPESKPSRRTLRWLAAVACLLLGGLFLFKASPPDLVWPGDPAPSATAVAPADSQPKYVTSNIEDIRVGDRVLGRNPELTDAERTVADPDPATWRRLELRAPKVDGTWADVALLRPVTWLEEREVKVGGTVHISVPECSIEGNAEVLAVADCPPIEPGTGPVVTGTFHHASGRVIDLHIEGLDEPIGTTANHPFWCEDRREFVRADELKTGERLRMLGGTTRVTAVIPRPQPEEVYNLEVQTEHVYHVGTAGILVHNGSPLWCPKSLSWRDSSTGRYTAAPSTRGGTRVGNLKPLDTPAHRAPRPGLRKLSDAELLKAARNPANGDSLVRNTRTGRLHDGNGRAIELQRRAADPNSTITPDTRVPVQDYTPDLSMFPDLD